MKSSLSLSNFNLICFVVLPYHTTEKWYYYCRKITTVIFNSVTNNLIYNLPLKSKSFFQCCSTLLYWVSTALNQRAKKVVSDSPGLVDFAIGLVNSVINLPDGQVNFFLRNSNYKRTVKSICSSKHFLG